MGFGNYSECEYLTCSGFFGLTFRCSKNQDEEVSSSRYDKYCKEDSECRTDDCEYYRDTGSVCFITLACLRQKLGNHCLELESLRSFRDSYMMSTSEGRYWTEQYYMLSPRIVKGINKRKESKRIWDEIYYKYVIPCVTLVKQGTIDSNKAAMDTMTSMLSALSHEYI